jgi:hypothetical protein
MLIRVLMAIPASVCMLACAASAGSASVSPLLDAERSRIKELSGVPLAEFLNRYYLRGVGPVEGVDVKASFNFSNKEALFRPRTVLREYCEANAGMLLRQASRQVSWASVSPEAFSDPRTSGTAEVTLRNMCDPGNMNPGCGASKASRNGAFGTFQCRAVATDALLWSVSIEGSTGKIIGRVTNAAEMRIAITPLR